MANHSSEHVCRVPLWGQSDHSLQFFHSAKILWNVCCPLDILLLQLAEAGLGEGGRVTPFLCCHPALSILGIFRVFHDNFLGYLEPRIFTSGCNLKKKSATITKPRQLHHGLGLLYLERSSSFLKSCVTCSLSLREKEQKAPEVAFKRYPGAGKMAQLVKGLAKQAR